MMHSLHEKINNDGLTPLHWLEYSGNGLSEGEKLILYILEL